MTLQKSLFEYNTKTTRYFPNYDEDLYNKLVANITVKNSIKSKSEIQNDKNNLPEVSEVELARHFTNLAKKNYSVDNGIYPLGSCTMKYNPKITEKIANYKNFNDLHSYAELKNMQGFLKVISETEKLLSIITGMEQTTLSPCAGAHGEFVGLLIIDKYHKTKGDFNRNKVILPKTAHGTNPASVSLANLEVVELETNIDGSINLDILKKTVGENTAAFMLTNPSTLGFFEKNILEISEIIHNNGGLLYYDGANLNALLGIAKPGDMGFDVMHCNVHKTFATPHGGGGAGAGPVSVKKFLEEFLPNPRIGFDSEKNEYFICGSHKNSIGKIRSYFCNFQVILKTYLYILMLGREGLRETGETAIFNANYLLKKIIDNDIFEYPFGDKTCMHEFVVSADNFKNENVKALDIAKRMIDYNIHPPTIYFPLIVHEAMMFEPTETESIERMDDLINVLLKIKEEIFNEPEKVKNAPIDTEIGRLDEVKAVKELNLIYKKI
ncbi:MAG: aminomethyl-transferring glycine dehydrogenase subunit GcvPB [Elusimicrobiota bacterium]|nr:aminomethyl-transferring glycine dehydrogenase subunit GcvPB [Elusimicrobiota bacterium]